MGRKVAVEDAELMDRSAGCFAMSVMKVRR
jgi:hypothetical protein